MSRPNFEKLAKKRRGFKVTERELVGHIPTIALTPVVDGRTGAYEPNQEQTWEMVQRVYDLITENVKLPDGTPVRVVVAPEMVYGPRTGAIAQEYYTTQGVSANIWISRSWSYSDELMSVANYIDITKGKYQRNKNIKPEKDIVDRFYNSFKTVTMEWTD